MIWLLIFGFIVVVTIVFSGVIVWIYKPSHYCNHSYERVDIYNNKKMTLVCKRCGKIKRFKK
jgi:hypothetical protein